MEKIIRLSIENTTKIRRVEDSFCELYSHDKNNGAFEFEISKGTLTNENVVALFKFLRSGSYWKTNGTVEGNKIKFNFDTSLITQNEDVVCYIYLDKESPRSEPGVKVENVFWGGAGLDSFPFLEVDYHAAIFKR